MFCFKHDYEMIQECVTKSPFEVATETISKVGTGSANIPWQMASTERKHITTFKCRKCGKLKRYIVKLA